MQRLLIIGLLVIAGCALISPNHYSNPDMGFRISLPNGWKYYEESSKEFDQPNKGALFSELGHDPFGHAMIVTVEPNKEISTTEKEKNKRLEALIEEEQHGEETIHGQVTTIGGYTALRLVVPNYKYEAQSCFYHRTRIFTDEKVFDIVFLILANLQGQYEKAFDRCVKSFRVIK